MKAAVVCLDPQFQSSANLMRMAMAQFTDMQMQESIVTEQTIRQDFSGIDFFYIWNGVDTSIIGFDNLVQHLILNPSNGKCTACGAPISDNKGYRFFSKPCPACNKPVSFASNFIYVFSGSYLRNDADQFFAVQMKTRFWASVDADWSLFRCLVQSLTTIPHLMIAPQKPLSPSRQLMVSHFRTPDESRMSRSLIDVKAFCESSGYVFNEDPTRLSETSIYIGQLFTGMPSQYGIDAIAMGIPTIANISKFYISHYPKFPAIQTTSDVLLKTVQSVCQQRMDPEFKNRIENGSNYVKQFFNPGRVAKQWFHIAKFIKDPHLYLDDLYPLPAYWALQGGYDMVAK